MKSFPNLVAVTVCAAMPYALQAQYPGAAQEFDTQMSRASSAQQQRDMQDAADKRRRNAGPAPYNPPEGTWTDYPAPGASKRYKADWKRAHAARKADKARKKDEKEHGHSLPGGAHMSPEGDLTMPDGTVHYNDSKKAERQRAKKREKMLEDLETVAKNPN